MAQKKGFKEHVRRFVVKIKRNPQKIGLVAFALTFIYYSLNLTCISNTTAKINGPGMGLCGFCTMLFSILALVCYMNSFPHRKKPNVAMIIIMAVMIGIVIYCDINYRSLIFKAVYRSVDPIKVTSSTAYIAKAASMLKNHIIFLGISCALTALMPVYSKLLKKINTSIDIDGYGNMQAIDIDEE
jgi:glucan phosphoethanolaminetransferase (alkaline phosphatase superfamily)